MTLLSQTAPTTNLTPDIPQLLNHSVEKMGAKLSPHGALIVNTAPRTGRSTKERFVVERPESGVHYGKVNQPISTAFADVLFATARTRIADHFRLQRFVGPYPVTVFSPSSWHIAFANNMFRAGPISSIQNRAGAHEIRIYHFPYNTVSDFGLKHDFETLILLDPLKREIVIIGTAYAGEIKKSAFAMANFLLPQAGLLPMHASANCREDGSESCVLFGLSGTGKTTLSASHDRFLIGDDEILWTPEGISNLEGGCYAKLIRLSEKTEPEIWSAVRRPGAILENVVHDDRGEIDFDNGSITENTRGSYPLSHNPKVFDQTREAASPRTIVFLTADAFGALPAVARLNPWQAQFHFVNGYTAKVAGTEIGVTEPQAVFSACFGAPFMPRPPSVYAKLLNQYAIHQGADVYLLNTGWTRSGSKNQLQRFPLSVSRSLLEAIQSGALKRAPTQTHPVFGFEVPTQCPGVPAEFLTIPSGEAVTKLRARFIENAKSLGDGIDRDVFEKGI